jgi:hypothetical protein
MVVVGEVGRSAVYMRYNNGPKTLPWGTPRDKSALPLGKYHDKLLGLSPRANYTDRATAACRRSDCQLLRIVGGHVVSVTDPDDRIFGFLDRSRYFPIK